MLLAYIDKHETQLSLIVGKKILNGNTEYLTNEGKLVNEIYKVNIDNFIKTYPGTYEYQAMETNQAIRFINKNWKHYYMYTFEEDIQFHEGFTAERLKDYPFMIIEKWTKDWFRKMKSSGTLCWVGHSEKEVFQKNKIDIITSIHNDQIRSLGGSPRLTYISEFGKRYSEAKPLSEKELLMLKEESLTLKFPSDEIIISEIQEKFIRMQTEEGKLQISLQRLKDKLEEIEKDLENFSSIEELKRKEDFYYEQIEEIQNSIDNIELTLRKKMIEDTE